MGLYFYSSVRSTFFVCHIMHGQVSREGVYVWCSKCVHTVLHSLYRILRQGMQSMPVSLKKKIVLQLSGALGFFFPLKIY